MTQNRRAEDEALFGSTTPDLRTDDRTVATGGVATGTGLRM